MIEGSMIERILGKGQKRTVLALHGDRQRLILELNECDAALSELAQLYRVGFGLPDGEYIFQGNEGEVKLVRVEGAPRMEEVDVGAEVG